MATSLPSEALGYSLNSTLGAALIGYGVSTFALGIFVAQVYRYYRYFPEDKGLYRYVVVPALTILELADHIFISHAIYFYMVKNFANPAALIEQHAVWSLILQIALGAVGGAIVKACFALRVWRFSQHNLGITGILLILVFAQLIFAGVYTAQGFAHISLPLIELTTSYTERLWGSLSLGVGATTDILTAFALCYYLHRLRTGYSKSDSLVRQLTLFAVNTGLLTSAASLATLILYNFMPANFIFMSVYFLVSKLYAISLLAALNTRQIVRGRGTEAKERSSFGNLHSRLPTRGPSQIGIPEGTSFHWVDSPQKPKGGLDLEGGMKIEVHHEVSTASDDLSSYSM